MNHRHLAAVAASALFCLFAAGCGAAADDPTSKQSKDVTESPPSSSGSTHTPTTSSGGDTTPTTDPLPTPPAEAGACHLEDATAQDVAVTFASGKPPAATGGKLEGKYVVTSAKVYLPNGAQPAKSTGTINAWGVFKDGNYNLSMKVDLTVATIIGNQVAKQDVVGQGTFSTSAEKVVIETSCEGSAKPDVQVAFSEDTSTLVVTAVQSGQTVYIELHATKS